MTKKSEKVKIYCLYISRQLGANAPLLVKITAVSAESADEAKAVGAEICRRAEAKANGRYVYKCKVLGRNNNG